MLYRLIKLISLASVHTFYRRVSSQHLDQIPNKGPIIFVCNHPNTMIDPLLVGTTCKRKLFFFAKATLFNNTFTNWILKNLQLVPVYRKQDDPSQAKKPSFISGSRGLTKNFERPYGLELNDGGKFNDLKD